MSNLNDRQKAFENKFKNDQDMQFRVQTRAVKQFGFWAAEKLGLSGDDAACYADQVVDADFEEPGVEDVFRKVEADFKAKSVDCERSEMQRVFDEKYNAAKASLLSDN